MAARNLLGKYLGDPGGSDLRVSLDLIAESGHRELAAVALRQDLGVTRGLIVMAQVLRRGAEANALAHLKKKESGALARDAL